MCEIRGHNSIYMYDVNQDGTLSLVRNCSSFTSGDAPRHNLPSSNGKLLYAVTEHSRSFPSQRLHVGAHKRQPHMWTCTELARTTCITHSGFPSFLTVGRCWNADSFSADRLRTDIEDRRTTFRGDTLRLSQDKKWLYATTRGSSRQIRGWLAVFAVQEDGSLASQPTARWETPTSGGKANALDTFPFHPSRDSARSRRDWILLTDDQDGYVWVLEWDGQSITIKGEVRLGEDEEGEEEGVGASHAVWLS